MLVLAASPSMMLSCAPCCCQAVSAVNWNERIQKRDAEGKTISIFSPTLYVMHVVLLCAHGEIMLEGERSRRALYTRQHRKCTWYNLLRFV